MPCQSPSHKEVLAAAVAFAFIVLVALRVEIGLSAFRTTLVLASAIAEVCIGIESAAGVVDVASCIPSPSTVGTGAERTVIACLAVAL